MPGRAAARGAAAAAPLAALTVAHVLAALLFSRGFLLTRVELPDAAAPGDRAAATATAAAGAAAAAAAAAGGGGAAPTAPPPAPPPYDRAVLLIVDALRFDFVCANASGAAPHAGAFPRTLALVGGAVSGGGGRRRLGHAMVESGAGVAGRPPAAARGCRPVDALAPRAHVIPLPSARATPRRRCGSWLTPQRSR
jgi:hypothetical protein